MPIYLNNAAVVKIATIDLSAYCKSITLNQSFDEVEVTAMGATSHVMAKGLENGSVDLVFLNDLVAAKVNATLQAAWGTTVSATFQQYSSATLATNPLYSSTILVNNLTPINGAPGDYSEQTLKFTCNSPIVVTTS
jgi:hypothetical protein